MAAAAVPIIASGISALAGWLANRKKQTQQQTTQTQNYNNLTTPEYDEKTAALRDLLINYYMDMIQGSDDMFVGYTQSGVNEIAKQADIEARNMSDLLSRRGVRGPAAAFASAQPMFNAGERTASFLNSIPLLKEQLKRQQLGETANFLSSIPKGARTTGTQTSSGMQTVTDPGNPWAGGLAGLGSSLAYFYGRGAFGGGESAGVPDFTMDNANSTYDILNRQPAQSYFNPRRYSLLSPYK